MISTTKVTAEKNPEYDTSPGNDTNDKVFLLSITEVNKYFNFSNDVARKCAPTDYAIANGAFTVDKYKTGGRATGWWWLRSPGDNRYCAADVDYAGSVDYGGDDARCSGHVVRPALWVEF